jgi:hypothetical protein
VCLPPPPPTHTHASVVQAIKDGGRIVVCCRGGESRSPAIVIAYLIQAKKASYDSVYADVEAACPGDPCTLYLCPPVHDCRCRVVCLLVGMQQLRSCYLVGCASCCRTVHLCMELSLSLCHP